VLQLNLYLLKAFCSYNEIHQNLNVRWRFNLGKRCFLKVRTD